MMVVPISRIPAAIATMANRIEIALTDVYSKRRTNSATTAQPRPSSQESHQGGSRRPRVRVRSAANAVTKPPRGWGRPGVYSRLAHGSIRVGFGLHTGAQSGVP